MTLPKTKHELIERWESGERFEFYFFYSHKPPPSGVDASCLSQWFVRTFEVDGIEYPTAEHWMMAEKARLFNDDKMLDQILSCDSPRDAKAYGRKVGGFDGATWANHRMSIVIQGNIAKFSQHDDLRQFLMATDGVITLNHRAVAEDAESYIVQPAAPPATARERLEIYSTQSDQQASGQDQNAHADSSNVVLVEAAGRDTIWGIGLGANNPKSQDPRTWRGLNLLGFALTIVREQLK